MVAVPLKQKGNVMSNITTPVELVGYTEILLVDRETKKVVRQVRQKNQITEPFARWLLTGNLATHSPTSNEQSSDMLTMDSNSVSLFLGSRSIPRFQTVLSDCGTGEFGIYLLSKDVHISPRTQIPPYLNGSLSALSTSRNNDGTSVLVYYGTASSQNTGDLMMAVDNGGCKWSSVLGNPAFTTTYVKDDNNVATIRSVVLGATHAQLTDSGYNAYIAIWQSPTIIPQGWDNAWDNAATSSETIKAPTIIDNYLIAPFLRGTIRDGRYSDGLYTTGKFGTSLNSFISYYDLGSKQFECNGSATSYNNAKVNGLTGEVYSTDPSKFVTAECAGGYAIGNGKAIRLLNGATTLNGSGECVKRGVKIASQTRLSPNGSGTFDPADIFSGTALESSATEGTTVPETIYKYAMPVMVAKRGVNPEDDVIEVFLSMGVGVFSDSTLGPTGTGIEIHKFTIKVGRWRTMEGTLTAAISSDVGLVVKHGRVAVLPYAIGRAAETWSLNGGETTRGQFYTFGTYDDAGNCYYLPITHLLNGVDLCDWTYTETDTDDRTPLYSANKNFQPGLILEPSATTGLARIGDFIFAMAPNRTMAGTVATRVAALVNDEGLRPVITNADQHWSQTHSLVMSGLTLDSPIQKSADQILVVRYTYAFEILPPKPARPVPFAVDVPDVQTATALTVTWTPTVHTERYLLRRAKLSDYSDEVRLPVPSPLISSTDGSYLDADLLPNTTYYYRLAATNVAGYNALWCEGSHKTNPLTETVAAPSSFTASEVYARSIHLTWAWNQPTPATDSLVINDITSFFERFQLQYQTITAGDGGLEAALSAARASEEGWTDVSNTALLTKTTTGLMLGSLSPLTQYYFRIRAKITPAYYENTVNAVSGWAYLSQETADLPAPEAVSGIVLTRTDYHFSTGDVEVAWQGQNDMRFKVNYKVDDVEAGYSATNLTEVQTNHVTLTGLPYGTTSSPGAWDKLSVKIAPFNETHAYSESSECNTEETSESYVLARNISADLSNPTGTLRAASNEAMGGPASEEESYGNFSAALFPRLFAQDSLAGTRYPVTLTIPGTYSEQAQSGTPFSERSRLRVTLKFENRIAAADELQAAPCLAWKMPFVLRKQVTATSAEANFTNGVKVAMTLYGCRENEEDVAIGTLNDVVDVAGNITTTTSFSTRNRPLVAANILDAQDQPQEFTSFKVEWVIETVSSGETLIDETETLLLELYMWGIITDSRYFEFNA